MKTILRNGVRVALIYLSLEILWRRWVWHQVPTQIGAGGVYLVVAVSLAIAWGMRKSPQNTVADLDQ